MKKILFILSFFALCATADAKKIAVETPCGTFMTDTDYWEGLSVREIINILESLCDDPNYDPQY